MRNISLSLFVFVLALSFLSSVVSAEIVIQSQPEEIYNFGSVLELPIKIVANQNIDGTLYADVLCDQSSKQFYMNDVFLESGEESSLNLVLRISEEKISKSAGLCKIKLTLGKEYQITEEFEVSDLIYIDLKMNSTSFSPEENVVIKGNAVREDGKDVTGIIELNIDRGENDILLIDSVKNGLFEVEFTLPKDMEAKDYLVNLKVYEKDSVGKITNLGEFGQSINVLQVPTSLEIFSETQVIEPGTNLKVKAILHDQTGKSMESQVIITIKNLANNILKQVEVATEEFVEYPVSYNYPPEEWVVRGVSNKFVAEQNIEIAKKEAVESKIVNGTLFLKNIGNVAYNQTLTIKIGDEELTLSPYIKVGEEKKYYLNAPNGNYNVEISGGSSNETYIAKGILLTGNAISIQEASQGLVKFVRHPFVWIFIIIILGFVAYNFFKKGHKKSFIGRMREHKSNNLPVEINRQFSDLSLSKSSRIKINFPAVLSLSMHGEKHKSGVVCLKISNLHSLLSSKRKFSEKNDGSALSTLQNVISLAEPSNSVVYETQEYFFFIFSPINTRTFDNAKSAYSLAEEIKKILDNHNKLYKEKINFGLALNTGDIIGKQDKASGEFKFMALGKLIGDSKKVATLSTYSYGDIYLTEDMNAKILSEAKTEVHVIRGMKLYTVKELKRKEQYSKFIGDFVRRQKSEFQRETKRNVKSFKDEISEFRGEEKEE